MKMKIPAFIPMPVADNRNNGQNVEVSLKKLKIINRGIAIVCGGTTIVNTTKMKRMLIPLKRSRAKAYPAREVVVTVMNMTPSAIKKVFFIASKKSIAEEDIRMVSKLILRGSQTTNGSFKSRKLVIAATNICKIG